MPRRATSKNLFGFGRKKVTTYKHSGSTRRDISSLAFKAGQRSGDTGLFSNWADSKNLKGHWDREALRQFEQSYRDGVEKGEAKERKIEEKREAKAKAKEELAEVQSDVIEALAGLGMSRSQAKTLARSKYRSGDSFGELFDRIMKRSAVGNPKGPIPPPAHRPITLQKAGWRLVDKFRTRGTAEKVREKYGPSRLIYRSGQWEVWTRQTINQNPFERVLLGDFSKRFGTMREGTITVQKPRLELIRKDQKRYGGDIYEVVDSGGKRVAYALVVRRAPNPAKFDRCVSDVSKSLKKAGRPGNAYAICTASGARNPVDFDAYWEKEGEKAGHAYPLNDYMHVWNALPIARQLRSMKTGRDVSNDMVRALRSFKSGFAKGKERGLLDRTSKRRTNPLEGAKKAYTDFTGLPATEVIEVKEQTHRHSTVFKTGQLVCLDIITPSGKEIPLVASGFSFEPKILLRRDLRHSARGEKATWNFDPSFKDKIVMVTFTEDGKQMMFTGGDQSLPLEVLGFGDRDMRDNMFIGTIMEITYRGRKKFEADGKEEVDFHHEFGRQGSRGMLPLLGYYLRSKQMFSLGGRYEIAPVRSDIGASPGIVG